MTKKKPWLTIPEAAKEHDITTGWIYQLCRDGKIEWKRGDIQRVKNQSLKRYLAKPENRKPGPKGGDR